MLYKFRAEVMDSSSDEESDQTTQTMATMAVSILHEHNISQIPVHRGFVKGRSKNLPRNRVEGHLRLHVDYFDRTNTVFLKKCSVTGTGCQGTYSWSFYKTSETMTRTSSEGPMQQVH